MKNTLLTLLLIASLLSCHKPSQPSESLSDSYNHMVEAVNNYRYAKQEDPESVKRNLDELEDVLRNLPREASTNDSLVWYAREGFRRYYSLTAMLGQFSSSLTFLDSLKAQSNPFIEAHALPEMYVLGANFSIMTGNADRAVALLDSFRLQPLPDDTPRIIWYNEMASSVYFMAGNMPEAIRRLEAAVNVYHDDVDYPNMGRVLAWLAVYYHQSNRLEEAVRTNLKAIEFYDTHVEDRSTVVAYGGQANLYWELGMPDKALDMNTKAIAVSKRNYSYNLGDIYRFRSNILEQIGQRDSAFHYHRLAADASQMNRRGVWGSKIGLINSCLNYPDSVAKARILIDELCVDSVNMPIDILSDLHHSRGRLLILSNQPRQALPELEKAIGGYEQIGLEESEQKARSLFMGICLKLGENARLAAGFKRYEELIDTLNQIETKRVVAGANIGFDTQRKEQENRLLTAEVKLKDSRLRSYAFIGLSLLIMGLCAGAWFWMRQHSLKLRLRLEEQESRITAIRLREQEAYMQQQEERLRQIIASRQELNKNNEDLLRQLNEIQAAHEKTCDLDKVMESLQPRLITSDEEESFRTAFGALHPSALHRLRSACPRITRAEELLCMLIILKQTNEEAARTLGISRSSVLQNRYRLKTKLQLPEGTELDAEIIRMAVAG